MKFAVIVFPGSQLRPGRVSRGDARARPGGRAHLAQGHRPEGRRRRHPAGRVRARRLPAHRRDGALLADHARGAGVRRPRRAGARHLQRLSDPARGGAAAGRDAAEPRAEVPLRARPRPGRADRHAVHRAARAPARCCGFRSGTAKATTSRRRRCSQRLEANRQVDLPLHRPPTGASTTRRIRTGRCNAIAGLCNERAQRGRHDAASRSAPASRCSAAPTACVIFESVVAVVAQSAAALDRRCRRSHRSTRRFSNATASSPTSTSASSRSSAASRT